MEELLQQVTNGLAVGGVYALVALGYTMVYGVLRLINFAHGELFTLGAYLGFTFLASSFAGGRLGTAGGLVVLALLVAGLVGLSGVLLERAAYRPLREAPRENGSVLQHGGDHAPAFGHQDVVGATGRGRIHHLHTDARVMQRARQARMRKALAAAGAQDHDLGFEA